MKSTSLSMSSLSCM